MRQLELALDQAGLRVEHVRLVVCTHAHSDHYGQAAPIMERTGAELWMHPNHEHMTKAAEDPERAFERRFEIARQSGVPADALAAYKEARGGQKFGIAEIVMPDRELRPGRGGGDRPRQLAGVRDARPRAVARGAPPARARPAALGRPPARPRLALLRLRLLARPGGRVPVEPRRGRRARRRSSCSPATAAPCATRAPSPRRTARAIAERIERIRAALADGPRTAFDIVPEMLDVELPGPMMIGWGLIRGALLPAPHGAGGEVERVDGEDPERWRLIGVR